MKKKELLSYCKDEIYDYFYECPNCGNKILFDFFKFCPECGKSTENYEFIEDKQ